MSRRANQKRRKKRRNRKLSLEQAKKDFHQKYPERGYCLPLFVINAYAQIYGREYANQRFQENRDSLLFDNILMKKKRKLYDYFFSHNRWQKGLDSLKTPGWAPNTQRNCESVQLPNSEVLINALNPDEKSFADK